MTKTCKNCYFFEWLNDNDGFCHRYPPSFLGKDDEHAQPAYVFMTQWCGEFISDKESK